MAGWIARHGNAVKKPALTVFRIFIFAMVQGGKPKARFIKIFCSVPILDWAA